MTDTKVPEELLPDVNGRKGCNAVRPYVKGDGNRWYHPEAKEIDNNLCDCCAMMLCPVCGTSWKEELPQ